jgi:hypothetical protein
MPPPFLGAALSDGVRSILRPGSAHSAFAVLDEFDLELRLSRLKRAQPAMLAQHERLIERLGAFPNQVTAAQYREVAANLAEVERHIEEIEFELLAIRWHRS